MTIATPVSDGLRWTGQPVLELRSDDLLDRLTESVTAYDRDGRLRYINAAGARLFSRPASDLLGRQLREVAPVDPDSPFQRGLREVLDGGPGRTVVRFAKSLQRWFEIDIHPIPEGALVIARDVTERTLAEEQRKQMQEQLAQAQRLEAIGRLAGGVAHDFNNILAVILGTAEVLLRRLSSDHPIRTELADIVGAAERATLVTRQLLAFGRKQRLAPHLVDLGDHVEHMSRMLQRLLGNEIQLELELARPTGRVRVDPGQIEQVVLNLVVNARDAMPGGGRVSIGTIEVTLPGGHHRADESVPPGRYVVLSVTDTGTGMTEAIQSHIFEPFFTTKELGRGTGLGLSTVHGIVEQSGGCIRVASESGTGTTFRVYLPRVDDARG
jgi:PAS domain S-box-containing protein